MQKRYWILFILLILVGFFIYKFFTPKIIVYSAKVSAEKKSKFELGFYSSIQELSATQMNKMKENSWHKGCPVALEDLRVVKVVFYGFDNTSHNGELIVQDKVAKDVVSVFQKLYKIKFPIEKMVPIDEYGGNDDLSVADNNTSGFNCRAVKNKKLYSMHAYGLAIDINPKINPYIAGESDDPYANREQNVQGIIKDNDEIVKAFETIGWKWGGAWETKKDYQHFSINGK